MAKRDSRPAGPGPDPPTAARQRGSLRGAAELCLSRTAPAPPLGGSSVARAPRRLALQAIIHRARTQPVPLRCRTPKGGYKTRV
jgi:hypothetical protein